MGTQLISWVTDCSLSHLGDRMRRRSVGNPSNTPGLLLLQILHHIFNPTYPEIILTLNITGYMESKEL
jgi:hypothetical protein